MMLSSSAKVIGITGIGGNGKSTLAAKYLEQKRGAEEISRWCWVDCREQGNTLQTQIVRTIEQVSGGEVRGSQLEQSAPDNVLEILFDVLGDDHAILIFDNIDQYVDVVECTPVGTMSRLIDLALTRNHNAQFVITGRPKLIYKDERFLHVELAGLTVEETRQLFEIAGARLQPVGAAERLAEVHSLTAGHALALNLIATQVAKNRADFDELLEKLRAGIEAGIENPILPNIWDTLNAKQQMVLRYLAEIVHPQSEQRVASYFGSALNYNQFSKAIRALKALNLVVVKPSGGDAADTIELHPLIRDFIRRRFQKEDRTPYIESILRFCDRMILKFREIMLTAPWSVLEHWIAKVELSLESGRLDDAFAALLEVHVPLVKGGYPEEFVRLGLQVLKHYEGSRDEAHIGSYDQLCKELVEILSQLGRYSEADKLLQQFEATVQGKTARYVLLCEMQSYSFWLRQNYTDSIRWAQEGVALKGAGRLDTQYDCSHNLALAQRDGGDVEPALRYFLAGERLEVVVDPNKVQRERGGHFYGNIGRCLHFQKKYPEALVCLRKSARLLEGDSSAISPMNNGWAAFWIAAMGEYEHAFAAFARAAMKWKQASPLRAKLAEEGAERVRGKVGPDIVLPGTEWESDRTFSSWLRG